MSSRQGVVGEQRVKCVNSNIISLKVEHVIYSYYIIRILKATMNIVTFKYSLNESVLKLVNYTYNNVLVYAIVHNL